VGGAVVGLAEGGGGVGAAGCAEGATGFAPLELLSAPPRAAMPGVAVTAVIGAAVGVACLSVVSDDRQAISKQQASSITRTTPT
ncbi:MAG: hypothetical protein AB7K36_07120, partial [Chloroflexota bacterium]